MQTNKDYDALSSEQIEEMKAKAVGAGHFPILHRSGRWTVEGHRLDLWFSRRHFPDPKPIVRRCWQSTPQWRERLAAYDAAYGSGPLQLSLVSIAHPEKRL